MAIWNLGADAWERVTASIGLVVDLGIFGCPYQSLVLAHNCPLPPITTPNQLLPKRRLSAVERLFFSANATGKHYAAAALEDCRRVATTFLLRAQGIAARADVALFYM